MAVNVKPRNEQNFSYHSPRQLIFDVFRRIVSFEGRRSGILQRVSNRGCFNSRIELAHTFPFRGDQEAS